MSCPEYRGVLIISRVLIHDLSPFKLKNVLNIEVSSFQRCRAKKCSTYALISRVSSSLRTEGVTQRGFHCIIIIRVSE